MDKERNFVVLTRSRNGIIYPSVIPAYTALQAVQRKLERQAGLKHNDPPEIIAVGATGMRMQSVKVGGIEIGGDFHG